MKSLTFLILVLFFITLIRGETEEDNHEIKHIEMLDKYLPECTVLLRKNGDFPLGEDVKKISLFGNGIRKTSKGGTGSGEVNSRYFENIETAFTKAGFEILTKDYLDTYDKEYDKAYKKLKNQVLLKILKNPAGGIMGALGATIEEPEYKAKIPEKGDVAIYVLSRISGEGSDRRYVKGEYHLTDTEKDIILKLARGFKKFMLVFNTGGVMDLTGLDEVKNILILSQLGVNTSKALVDIVQGKSYPSGKLTTTWTTKDNYPTIGTFGDTYDTEYKEGIYVGYRYFDTANIDVSYPFGYGLGYTEFNYTLESVNLVKDEVKVKASIKNTGHFKGKEVLQLYLTKPMTELDEPYQSLVAFEKSKELAPEEEDVLSINFKLSDFASYYAKNATFILDKGDYVVRLGNSSRNTIPCAVINIESRIVVRQVHNKLSDNDFQDVKLGKENTRPTEDLSDVQKFVLDAHSIETEFIAYDKVFEIPEEVKNLSLEEKAHLVIGKFSPNGGITSTVGGVFTTVAGAAGETAQVANLLPIVMADGPAGLRVSTDYYTKDGENFSTQGGVPQSMQDLLPGILQWILSLFNPKPPKDAVIKHQYTTAIPVGTAIAQTWNKEFAKVCGDVVGAEMELYRVNLWLAPALNIQRNILCGRNYEYYSEDPYVSGIIAAAVTNGVQKHKNAFVTLKHFAVNNQENFRYTSSSNLSERALREIYLKGFEIAIKLSKPRSIMTSYNLINGVHTNESKELNYDILRQEFGFDGLVMTDWLFTTLLTDKNPKYPNPTASGVIKSTNDLYMPGTQEDYDDVLDAINKGKLTMDELDFCAANVYKLAKEIEN